MIEKLQFGFRRSVPPHLQTEATECGLACLSMIAVFHGHDTDLPALRRRFAPSLKGSTLADLIKTGSALGLAGRALSLELEDLRLLQLPCILHWDFSHFLVLERIHRNYVVLVDPAIGTRKATMNEVSQHFSGVALELIPTLPFKPKNDRQRIRLRDLMGKATNVGRAVSKIFLLALALEIFSLVAPFYSQWVIDEAIATGDRNLLLTLAVGFCLLTSIQVITEAVRGWAVVKFSTLINLQWLANVFRHLVRLPIDYFAKRHIGDIMSRFDSVNAIQQSLTVGLIEAVLDGLMSVGTVAIMLIYDSWLSMISVLAVVLYIIMRVCLYSALRMANQQEIVFAARGRSLLMETVRGIQSIRLFGRADERLSRWLNIVVKEKNCGLRSQRLLLIFRTSSQMIFGIEVILVIFIGAEAVMGGELSVGMLLAFLSYRGQFTTRATALIDRFYELQILKIHAARLADIVLTEPEFEHDFSERVESKITPFIEVRQLSYGYSRDEKKIIDGFSMRVESAQSVAIVGPSGCGKTTLLKLLTGLLKPDAGEVLIGGIPILKLGLAKYRSMIGVVMQDDRLFAGSIVENISFFDERTDEAWVRECATMACIHDEIAAMPMGYDTFIGDMGSALSAGQRQRIMLARALYRRPSVLFLDEATSNLDVSNERAVNAAVCALKITRVIVAHRPETIASADKAVNLMPSETTE